MVCTSAAGVMVCKPPGVCCHATCLPPPRKLRRARRLGRGTVHSSSKLPSGPRGHSRYGCRARHQL